MPSILKTPGSAPNTYVPIYRIDCQYLHIIMVIKHITSWYQIYGKFSILFIKTFLFNNFSTYFTCVKSLG